MEMRARGAGIFYSRAEYLGILIVLKTYALYVTLFSRPLVCAQGTLDRLRGAHSKDDLTFKCF